MQRYELLSFRRDLVFLHSYFTPQDYTVSIKSMNTDAGSSSYELSFSRVRKRSRMTSLSVPLDTHGQDELYNPHEEARQYFQSILRLGPLLSASFHQLVETLRGTLPIVCTINTLQERADSGTDLEARSTRVWHVSKAAGWYRILYGDSRLVLHLSFEVSINMKLTFYVRHALDIRLMRYQRVAVLDASLPLTSKTPREINRILSLASKTSNSGKQEKGTGKPSSGVYDTLLSHKRYAGTFLPIPDFSELLESTIRSCRNEKQINGVNMHVVRVDRGLICDVSSVQNYVSRIHSLVLKKLGPTSGVR